MAKFADEDAPTVAPQGVIPTTPTPQPVVNQPQQTTPVQTPMPAAGVPEKSTCPGCKTKLENLNYKRCSIEQGKAASDGLSKMIDFDSNGEENELVVFTCPKCNVVLFADEDDAVDFLDSE
jgi:hypothetical protein